MDPIAPEGAAATAASPSLPSGCLDGRPAWRDRPIETARLRLRRLEPADAPVVAELLDDWEVVRNTSNIPFPYSIETAVDFVAKVAEETAGGRALVFAVEERLTGRMIGCIGSSIAEGRAEIGYWLGRDFWNRGYAGEALARCLRLLFDDFAVEEAWASVLPGNAGSRRLLDKAGFQFDETRRCELPARGIVDDLDFLVLPRAVWRQRRDARPILLVAAAALVDADGRVLLAQRPPGKSMAGHWEFPGGKLQAGESPEAALVRELKEELGIDVSQSCLAPLAFASHDYDSFHLMMPLYVCRRWEGLPRPCEGQTLAWALPARLGDYPMPPADIPLVAHLRDWL